jgi:hypothetical protein
MLRGLHIDQIVRSGALRRGNSTKFGCAIAFQPRANRFG